MQVRPAPSRPKYKINDYALPGNHATNKMVYTNQPKTTQLQCICREPTKNQSKKCCRCGNIYHKCVVKDRDIKEWQCLHCDGYYMDPIFSVDQILIDTFFKTDSVYEYTNLFEFHFNLSAAQLQHPVEVRCLQDDRGSVLAWPMQGQFYVNKEEHSDPVVDFKPLLFNSNRKHRKEQPLILPANKLQKGLNILTFTIPRLDRQTFGPKYQCDQRAVYYIGVYAIKKLNKEQLISKMIKKNRIDKESSLQLFRKLIDNGDADLSVQKIKLCLECPYTKNRIKIPVRGRHCTHYTCLCLDTLIQTRMGMNTREWSCPICSNKINEPIIDKFILSMLNDGSAGVEVMLSINGDYHWIQSKNNEIDLDSDEESIIPKPEQKKQPINKTKQAATKIKKPQNKAVEPNKHVETINLDDDSPEPEAPSRKLPQLEIVIPQELKQKSKLIQEVQSKYSFIAEKEKKPSKNREKERKQKQPQQNTLYNYILSEKKDNLITDIKEIEFRNLSQGQFFKKYFAIEPPRNKVNDDLRNIFKEVL